ncbi:G-type lectin S-receptor-like serine/threonine-protein kinase B120 [Triticum dicoccoides]|uniref:G-type lectin S-receptor-like serine/threonine-protein kinase B120 n=1 Tax=Triticum dicoccoides TaxID=85692 RepID=UPI000E7946C0|nr:G-type lectin S-receptor-like serine/threonine-protein kinase B120 [Triticum dicoccoides]
MAMLYIPIFFLLFLSSFCKPDDQLTQAKPLTDRDILISENRVFALGFFSPTSSNKSFYLGIWYHSLPGPQTVVWIANRDDPIINPSSMMLKVTNNSRMVLSNSEGRDIWMAANNITTEAVGAYAVLLNSGNFILRSSDDQDIWLSFDNPTDTVLPSMRFVVSYKAQVIARLVAWKGPDDPSSGDFSCSGDPRSPDLQLVTLNKARVYCRIIVWDGVSVSGRTFLTITSSILYQTVVNSGDEFSFMFTLSNNSPFVRLMLDYTGKLKALAWDNHSMSWTVINELPNNACDLYGSCGPFGYCDFTEAIPTCQCFDGFEPVDSSNSFKGCQRTQALKCRKQSHFTSFPGMKVPDMFLHIRNRNLDDCAAECINNCSCTAYAYADLSSGGAMADPSRCLVWLGELIDAQKATGGGENLYLRLADSPVHKKTSPVKIVLPIISCLLLLACTVFVWMYKYRGKWAKKKNQKKLMLGYISTSNSLEGNNTEFPCFSYEDILSATNFFADSSLLGRGGFGKVYKGTLEGGNEVAVKRLSKSSGQGIVEFKNEIVLIAKLQHKNLVRLLGCCIHEDEKLLIYEYLANKSLDAFLFDHARKHVLDWLTRFKIIKGVARGLLYLHQDSRLTVIHRDLKASNILLDIEMTPKISDFGMARIFGANQNHANTTRVVGTYGYMSPEYAMGGAFSVKSDTYSFGVLLLEIVSGMKISSPQLNMEFCSLISYAWRLWEDGKATELVDSFIAASCSLHEIVRCIHVGLLCVQDNPNDRPLMSSVMFMLENESAMLPPPKHPVYFALGNYEGEQAREGMSSTNEMSMTMLKGR